MSSLFLCFSFVNLIQCEMMVYLVNDSLPLPATATAAATAAAAAAAAANEVICQQ